MKRLTSLIYALLLICSSNYASAPQVVKEECTICWEKKTSKDFTFLPCTHRYCISCLSKWINAAPKQNCCPECRKRITPDFIDAINGKNNKPVPRRRIAPQNPAPINPPLIPQANIARQNNRECSSDDKFCACCSTTCIICCIACCTIGHREEQARIEFIQQRLNLCEIESQKIHNWQPHLHLLQPYDYSQMFMRGPNDWVSPDSLVCAQSLARILNTDTLKKLNFPAGPKTETMEEQDSQCQRLNQLEQQVATDHNRSMKSIMTLYQYYSPTVWAQGQNRESPLAKALTINLKTIGTLRVTSRCHNMPEANIHCLAADEMEQHEISNNNTLVNMLKKLLVSTSQDLLAQRIHAAKLQNIKKIREKNNCLEKEDDKKNN